MVTVLVEFLFEPASCERVFALLKRMFGEQQLAALADQIRAGVMLAYNDRTVG